MPSQDFPRSRMGENQMETLLSYMEQHTLFSRGQITKLGAQGHVKYKTMWNELASTLNRIGPSVKDVAAWQKSWTKLRLNAKTKKASFLKQLRKTGHDAPTTSLSRRDDRISQIYGKYGTGMNLGRELGFKRVESHESEDDDSASLEELLNSMNFLATESLILLEAIPSSWNHMFWEFDFTVYDHHSDRPSQNSVMHKKPTDKQIQRLIQHMRDHPLLARGQDPNAANQWLVVITLLNGIEGATKNDREWRTTWNKMVAAARQNVTLLLNGNRTSPIPPHYVQIINIVGYEDYAASPRARVRNVPEDQGMNGLPAPTNSSRATYRNNILPSTSNNYNFNNDLASTSQSNTSHGLVTPTTCTNYSAVPSSCYGMPSSSQTYRNNVLPSTSSNYSFNNDLPCTSQSSSSHGLVTPRIDPVMASTSNNFSGGPTRPTQTDRRQRNMAQLPYQQFPSMGRLMDSKRGNGNFAPATSTSATSTASSATSAPDKSTKFLKAFEDKGSEMVMTLAKQLVTCFEKQNEAMKNGLQELGKSLMQGLPTMIGNEFNRALNNAKLLQNGESSVPTQVVDDAVVESTESTEEIPVETVQEPVESVEEPVHTPLVEDCAICQDMLLNPKELKCKHTFCTACIDTWKTHSKLCPICRETIDDLEEAEEEWTWAMLAPDSEDGDS